MQDDEAGKCLNKQKINDVANKIHKQDSIITSFIKKAKQQAAPLPFSLSTLQKKASSLYGFTAKKTLSIAQELYEKYKATSYPRTDSNYLPVSQFNEAKQILESLKQGDNSLIQLINECDVNFKSSAWNDKKVSAHHGIIPTTKKVKFESMPADVAKLYNLIRMVYIAQFLGDYKYKHSKIIVDCQGELFTATGKIPMLLGWKNALSKELWGSESKGKDETVQDLPNWHEDQQLLETAQKIA
jgi:DNA topoisomerase-3